MIGLLAVTGMRIGEVLRLNTVDVDWDTGVLTVWLSKFNKSRHVPVTASTLAALNRYRDQRGRHPVIKQPALFVSPDGRRLSYPTFGRAFHTLLEATGITAASGRARIYDMRHSFAVRTVLGWYRDGADVQALLPRLSTYLGHVAPSSTYWYLHAAPELMAIAARATRRPPGGGAPVSTLAPILEAFFTERLCHQLRASSHTVAPTGTRSGSCSSTPTSAPASHPPSLTSPTWMPR